MASTGMRLTNLGLDVLAKALAGRTTSDGSQIHFSRVSIGDSVKNNAVVSVTDDSILERTALIHKIQDLPITGIEFSGTGTAVIHCQVSNANVTTDFFMREIALFATDQDSNAEVLYAYCNRGNLGEPIPAGGGSYVVNTTLSIVTVVSNVANVTANINGDLVWVKQSVFDNHVNSTSPHPNFLQKKSAVTTSASLWATGGNTGHIRPMSIENVGRQILGGDANQIPNLASRVTQNEINIANLFMQLDSEAESGLEANLLIFEDFTGDADVIDRFQSKVTNTVAAVNNLYVDSIEGLLAGHWYTISDGVRQEFVRVKSIALNDGAYSVIFDQDLTKTFKVADTKIFRTTANIGDGFASGAGDILSKTFVYNRVYQGKSSTSEVQVEYFDISLNDVDNGDISLKYSVNAKDGDINSEGEFTLSTN